MPKFNAAFRKWFGNSVVRNEDGSPMVVYHGTTENFNSFRFNADEFSHMGCHFGTYEQAVKALKNKKAEMGKKSGRVMPVFLSIQNPLRSTDAGDWSNSYQAWVTLDKALKGGLGKYDFVLNKIPRQDRFDRIVEIVRSLGYDGIVYKNRIEGKGNSWIALRPEQIKSIDNDGTWDADDPNIGSNPEEAMVRIPIYRVSEVQENPDPAEAFSVPRYRISLVKEAELEWPTATLSSPAECYAMAKQIFEGLDRESVYVFLLDQKYKLLGINLVAMGSLTEALVHPRELFKAVVLANAATFIMVHNHPSGDPTPSVADRRLTSRIKDISTLIGVRMIDSIIAGESNYYSFSESGALESTSASVIRVGESGELKMDLTSGYGGQVDSNPPARFWGRAGAGILFHCTADDTYLLVLRSAMVEQPGTLGIPGGSCSGEDFFTGKQGKQIGEAQAWACASREVKEELGWWPKQKKAASVVVYERENFQYRTFVIEIPDNEKEEASRLIKLNWENDEFLWMSLDEMIEAREQLHFGARYVIDRIGR